MRIKRLRFKNGYKRFKDLTIDLGDHPARIVALVGPNGCGKSSVLDGLIFHAKAYGHSLGPVGSKDYSYHSMEGDPNYDYSNVEIEFASGSFDKVWQSRRVAEKSTIFSFRSPYRYNATVKITQTQAVREIRLNVDGAADAASIDSKMEENYRRLLAAVSRYRDENDVKPSEAIKKVLDDLNTSIRECLDLEIASVGAVEASKGTLYFKKSNHPKDFEYNVLSAGEKEVIDLLIDIYLRREDFSDTIFLFDEPELHLNTAVQGKLLVEIEKLIGDECQIWLTTHSIGMLRSLQKEMKGKCQIIQFRADQDLASKAQVLCPVKNSAATWRDVFAVALDDIAELVSPRTIIYCEGRAEPGKFGSERGMDAQAFNAIFAASNPDVLFVSSGGNTELDQRSAIAIAILGKVFPTVEVLLLKDRDMASGKNTTEHDRKIYLENNPKRHRVLKRWEIENYLFDKEVLKIYCLDKGLQFDEAAYDNFVKNIYDQNLKDKVTYIRNFCGIKGSVSAENFKLAVAPYLTEGMDAFKELRSCIFDRL